MMTADVNEDPTLKRADSLFRLLSDPAAWEKGSTEGANAARGLVTLMQNQKLRLELAPEGSRTHVGAPVIQTVYVQSNETAWDISSDFMKCCPCRSDDNPVGIIDTVSFFLIRLGSAITDRKQGSSRVAEIQSAVDDLVATLKLGLKPAILHDRKGALWEELYELFENEPVQQGAGQIARRLRRRTADVRARLNEWVKDGTLEATGTTRNRQYRRVHESSESSPESGRETAAATGLAVVSRPRSGRKRVA
jgi:hypothetical protein